MLRRWFASICEGRARELLALVAVEHFGPAMLAQAILQAALSTVVPGKYA